MKDLAPRWWPTTVHPNHQRKWGDHEQDEAAEKLQGQLQLHHSSRRQDPCFDRARFSLRSFITVVVVACLATRATRIGFWNLFFFMALVYHTLSRLYTQAALTRTSPFK